MAFIVDDRVRETTTIVGTGPVTTLGPPNGFQTFGNVMSVGDTTWYAIVQPGGNWETGKVRVEDQLEFVDCSSLDEDIHAIQWYGTVGEVEYKTDFVNNICRPNERITDIAPYQHMMELWTIEAKKPAPTTAVPTTAA